MIEKRCLPIFILPDFIVSTFLLTAYMVSTLINRKIPPLSAFPV